MYVVKHSSIRTLFVLALTALSTFPITLLAGKPAALVVIDGNGVAFSADAALYVRIGGPDDYFSELRGEGYLQWVPEYGLPDGTYRYDCYATANEQRDRSLGKQAQEKAARADSSRTHGVFLIENGVLREKDEVVGPEDEPERADLSLHRPVGESGYVRLLWEAVGGVLDALVPPAQALETIADDLEVQGYIELVDTIPTLYFYDTGMAGYNWEIRADDDVFRIRDTLGSNTNDALTIDSASGSTAVNNAIRVEENGDVSFADSTVYIEKSEGEVGIGTLTPLGNIHIVEPSPELVLESTLGSQRWELEALANVLNINRNNGLPVVQIFDDVETYTLVLGNNGVASRNVGMGTDAPDTGLHIRRNDGKGAVKVQETHGTTAQRFQVQLENNGGTGFKFTDTSVANREWQNAMLSNGDFAFSFIGTGGAEVQVKPSGEVRMGPGPTINFQLKTNGDLSIPNGKVVATAFQQSSSRTVKQGFTAVDEGEVLDKLLALEISEWEYKDPNVAGRHLGPMAEEFYTAFGFGASEKHIYPADMAAVSLVAARQLQRELMQRDETISVIEQQNAELKMANSELRERVARLETLMTQISSNSLQEQ